MVRAGRRGEQEQGAFQHGVAVIGWNELPDLSAIKSREELAELFERTFPHEKPNAITNWVGQVWAFLRRIQLNDLVVLPLKTQSAIAIGRVSGNYTYRTDLGTGIHHTRSVKWIKTDIPKTAFQQDLLYSFGAYMTVCQISRNNAEQRVRAIVEGKQLPPTMQPAEEAEELQPRDIEQVSHDQIITYINQEFKGNELAAVVEGVLRAEGYVTRASAPGADGGVDILAGKGAFGFDPPHICVQVKSQDSPLDVTVLRSLQGSVQTFGAEQGLLISLGGFNNRVWEEARRSYFKIRLWDADTLVDAIETNYERVPEDVRARLPLKRVWALVPPETE